MKNLAKKYIIKIPKDILVFYCDIKRILTFIGPTGKKSFQIKNKIFLFEKEKLIKVTRIPFFNISNDQKKTLKAFQGTTVAIIKQIILEISFLLCKKLKLIGVGYKVLPLDIMKTKFLHFKLGCSHQIYFKIPKELTIFCFKFSNIFIFANSYPYLTKVASLIKSYKYPEPYKGKGILYENEKITLKEGKKV